MEVTMRFDLGQASQLLARTPPTLRALLAGVDDAWLDAVRSRLISVAETQRG